MQLSSIATDIATGGATGVGGGSTPTLDLNTGLTFEESSPDLTIDPGNTSLISTTETIDLGGLRDMGLLPPSQVLVDQALHLGIDLDPATADLASDFKVAALANSPKFIEQGYRPDIMNAIAAGMFNGYVQTLEATDPAALDPYRISEGAIYLTGQFADNRPVFSQIDDNGLHHYLRATSENAEIALAFIRGNNVPPERANALIESGVEKGLFAHVPHAGVEDVARVVIDNTPGLTSPAPAPAPAEAAPVVSEPPPTAIMEAPLPGSFTQIGNTYTVTTEQGTQISLTNRTQDLHDRPLGDGAFQYGGVEIRSPFFSGDGELEAGAILGVQQGPSQTFEGRTDDGAVITGGGGLREFAVKLFANYNADLGDNVNLGILGQAGIEGQQAMDTHWAAREVYDNTVFALNAAITAGLGPVEIGANLAGQEGSITIEGLHAQLLAGQAGLRLEAHYDADGGLEPVLRFVHTIDGQGISHDRLRSDAPHDAIQIQVAPTTDGIEASAELRISW